MTIVLPQSTVQLINTLPDDHRHPGLQLDKFSIPGDQQAQKGALGKVCKASGDHDLLTLLLDRRNRLLNTFPGADSFACTTTGPLTLHLARAAVLENAGICLHPIYGFAYLPGSGLKGMARAYAETVWLPVQANRKQAWRQIENVFGWAPNPDRKRQINDPNHPAEPRIVNDAEPESPEIKAHVGDIVFHDAWPESWPQLIVDIVNNHHPDYYQAALDDNDHPPGDWEDPKPVYFLAVKPETTFSFPLAKRRADVTDDLLDLARQWLLGALCQLGAGAKTAVGYGAFKPADDCPAKLVSITQSTWTTATQPQQHRAEFSATLELVTPAFMAGANQQADDCDLRAATLRGLLRWWWRTMHSGFLDVKTLRALEAAIWGDTHSGGAVRTVVERVSNGQPHSYDKRSKANFSAQQKVSDLGIPNGNGDARKMTQGLWYVSYGMDEGGQHNHRERYVIEPPSSWRARLIARRNRFESNGPEMTAQQVLEQAQAALWLLCHFGGVGSKARKGFGSLAAGDLNDHTLGSCQSAAAQLRQELGLSNDFEEDRARSPSLRQMLGPVEASFTWPDVWRVLDQVGFAYQSFAKKYKHRLKKNALGLPRRVGSPTQGSFNPTPPVTSNSRHSSPVHIHIARVDNGWVVRTVAFPSAYLPNLSASRDFLEEFLEDFDRDLQRRTVLSPPSGAGRPTRSPREQPTMKDRSDLPKPGDYVEATLLDEKSKKGGWKAKHEASGLSGPIQNTADVPVDKQVGEKLSLIVASVTAREIAFRYPTPEIEKRAQAGRRKGKGKSGRPQKRGRRT